MGQTPEKRIAEPWSMLELNRIVMSARTMREAVGEIPGKHWWPALILLILDIDVGAELAVQVPARAMDLRAGRISCRHVLYQLHATTLEAFSALPANRKCLLPWPKDSGKPPFHMLYREFKTVLYRAGLPYTDLHSFIRLQLTTRRIRNVLDRIQPVLEFQPHNGKPQLRRTRDCRQHALAKNIALVPPTESADKLIPTKHLVLLANAVKLSENPDTLLNIFRSKYRPTVLRQADAKTVSQYERTLRLLHSFTGREVVFADLTDELAAEFLSDCLERGAKPATCNHYRAALLALWRFGWKKRLTNEQPRDVPKLRVDEVMPDAWTTTEIERILMAACRQSGTVCDIPAGIWWPAFILTLYDTGLRFNALMLRPATDLDMESGWLAIDAADQKQRKAQALKLHSDTLEFVRAMEPADRPFLFPWPYASGHMIRNRYRAILEEAGLTSSKRDLFHKLRRTSATSVAVATNENTARDHMGHSSVQITRRYLDRRQLQPVAAADIISRPRIVCPERR